MENIGALALILSFCLAVYSVIASLVGKWKSSTGQVLEFTKDSMIENGKTSKATFATEGNVVTIISEEGGGMAAQISLSNSNNTAMLTVGGMPIAAMQRVRD